MTEPQLGDFEVVRINSAVGRVIRLGQYLNGDGFADYEHARLYVGEGRCVEADPGGARIVRYDPNDGGVWSTGYIKLTDTERQTIAKAGIGYAKAHVPYSGVDYFALAAYRLKIGLLVPGLRIYVANSSHMICSQLVDKCYQDAGVQLFNDNRWNGYVTPGALTRLIFRHYG